MPCAIAKTIHQLNAADPSLFAKTRLDVRLVNRGNTPSVWRASIRTVIEDKLVFSKPLMRDLMADPTTLSEAIDELEALCEFSYSDAKVNATTETMV